MSHNPKSHRICFVLRPGSGSYRFNATQCHCEGTNQGYGETQAVTNQMLDYLATHPDAII
jgi:hypothetical protein